MKGARKSSKDTSSPGGGNTDRQDVSKSKKGSVKRDKGSRIWFADDIETPTCTASQDENCKEKVGTPPECPGKSKGSQDTGSGCCPTDLPCTVVHTMKRLER